MLGDAERRRHARGADRGDVDQPGTGGRRADHVVHSAARGSQARPARDRLGALERRQHRDRTRQDLLAGLVAHRPVGLVGLVVGGRARDDPAVDRGEHQHALRPLRRDRQQDALERTAAGRIEGEELALAREDREALVARQPGDVVGMQAGAVDRDAARHRVPGRELQREPAARAADRLDARAGADLRATGRSGQRERARVGDRVGDRLPGHVERAVVAQRDIDPVDPRGRRERGDAARLLLVARREGRAAAQDGYAGVLDDGVAQRRRAQDQRGLELPGRRVEPRVEDARVGAARAERELVLGLEHQRADPAARERVRDRHADHAAADDGDGNLDARAGHAGVLPARRPRRDNLAPWDRSRSRTSGPSR